MEEIDFSKLPKKERKRLKREMERSEEEKKQTTGKIVKLLGTVVLLFILAIGGWFLFKEVSKPLPGQSVEDQGRQHVPKEEWEKFTYNSNPPTSGSHDAEWKRAGVYNEPQGDGYLVHSLEHGYVIISYNCGQVGGASGREILFASLDDQACEDLKRRLSDLANEKKLSKLIVVPSQKIQVRIALTAWMRIEELDGVDKERVSRFIDAYRDHGPEQTME